MNQHLADFVQQMDMLVAQEDDPATIAHQTKAHLAELIKHPEFLEDRHRQPAADNYRQHVVHVHPEGKYSIVSLVWKPGQATSIHDHRCWCVVGVLQGKEAETRYALYEQDGSPLLTLGRQSQYEAGGVCALVPPEEDIHKVANGGSEGLTISIHIYGADIATLGSSINHVFEQPVFPTVPNGAEPISWRAFA